MGVLLKKQGGNLVFTGIARLAVISLIVTMAYAFVDTIWAIHMENIIKNISLVSFFTAFLTFISFISYFVFIPMIERTNKSKLFFFSLLFIGLTYLGLFFSKSFTFFAISAICLVILTTLRITSFGIIVKDSSPHGQLCQNEGVMYTFFNVAWVLGPLLAGYISEKFGIPIIFIFSAIFIILAVFLFKISHINDLNIHKKSEKSIIRDFIEFFKNKDHLISYVVGGGAPFWLILIYLYMPIYMIQHGLNTMHVGIFLFAFSIPLILIEYRVAKSISNHGFRKTFKTAFLILASASFLCFLISQFYPDMFFGFKTIYVLLALLVLGSFGIAMLEPITEAYFFNVVQYKRDETRFYGPYNTTIDSAHFIAKILSGLILLILPFKFLFLFFTLAMLFFYFIARKTRGIIENME